MSELFLQVVNMSISASWLVLAVLALRLVLKKAPKWGIVLLWGIVALRLVFPFDLESAFSLIPSVETIPVDIAMEEVPTINSGIPVIDKAVNPVISQSNTPVVGGSVNPLQISIGVVSVLWCVGVAVLVCYTAVSYWRLRRRVAESTRLRENIFQCEDIASPFILGIIKPRIYLSYHMNEQDMSHVIAHEEAHIQRKDHWWKPLGFLLLAIHWFNPLMWLAYILLCRDIELACDEKVIQKLGNEARADYAEALVSCSANRRMIAACPLAFGEVGVKVRIKSVMQYKKPAFWIAAAAVTVCAVAAVCFLTNPIKVRIDPSEVETVTVDGVPVSEESQDALIELLNDHRKTNFAVGWDDPNSLSIAVQIHCADGGFYLLHYQYYSGFSFSPKNPGEDDYRSILTYFGPDGEKDAWKMEYEFDSEFSTWYSETTGRLANSVKSDVQVWFDDYHSGGFQWDGMREISVDAFPAVTFRWTHEKVVAVVDGEISPLYTGMPIWNVFFTDLTGDGLPELCSTISIGSGIVDERVMIYDYANGLSYSLEDRMEYDYSLSVQNDQLIVTKRIFSVENSGEIVDRGYLSYKDGTVTILPTGVPSDTSNVSQDPQGVRWTYSPVMSATWYGYFYFNFDLPMKTRIVASCDNGTLLNVSGQSSGKIMHFENGQPVCWFPGMDNDLSDTAEYATINFTVYDGDEMLYSGIIDITRTGIENSQSFYEATLSGTDLLELQQADNSAVVVQSDRTAILAYTDLNHNGVTDNVIVSEVHPGSMLYELRVEEKGEVIWSTEAASARAGWNTIMLYSNSEGDHLVQYQPSMSQGMGSYSCAVFSLEDNKQTVKSEWTVDFNVPFTEETAEMKKFAEEVGLLLRNCYVLLSTEQGITVTQYTSATYLPQIYPVRFDPEEIQTAIDGTAQEQNLTANAAQLPGESLEFLFASGAGGWGTVLTLAPDGSFTGVYSDMDMGSATRYISEFTGTFSEIRQINDFAWTMKLEELTLAKEPEQTWVEDGIRYIASEPHGLTDGEEFILYAPGTPADLLSAGCRDWWPYAYLWRAGEKENIDGWCLCNVNTGHGFFS